MHAWVDPPSWAGELVTVGVTGTNGKTSTTTFVAAALSALGPPVVRVTSVGAFVGDERLELELDHAGFLEAMRAGHARGARHAAIEITSEALAAGFARAWPCRVGVLTSFDRDHLDAHGSAEHYLASKAQLFVSLPPGGVAVLSAGTPACELVLEVVPEGVAVIRYGSGATELTATAIEPSWGGTRARLGGTLPGLPAELETRGIGAHFVDNALGALAAAVACGVPADAAARAIGRAPAPPGRFECIAREPWVVIDYAHTPAALAGAVATARALARGKTTLVFGAGGNRDREKRRQLGVAAAGADRVIVTNDNPRDADPSEIAADVRRGLGEHPDVRVELDRARAIALAVREARPDDIVLVAGRGHETVQIVGSERRALSDAEVALRSFAARAKTGLRD
jgi:UDP-N-acetylmuramoyl-L-alanyl-D-glutamate--2,6-diaminopimelate ligase